LLESAVVPFNFRGTTQGLPKIFNEIQNSYDFVNFAIPKAVTMKSIIV
jgi:hypothetical protein